MKNLLKKVLFTVLSVALAATMVSANVNASVMSIKNNNDGTITLTYNNNTGKRVKIKVSKNSTNYYEMASGKNEVVIPLPEGNGTYTIKCYVNTTGTSYKSVETQTVKNNVSDELSVFTKSSMVVKFTDEAVKKAAELTKNSKTEAEKINAIYSYIVNNFSYDYDKVNNLPANTTYVPNADSVLSAKKGICLDISTLMAVMLRSQGIETKVVTGTCTKVKTLHAWNQIYDETTKTWMIVDATRDMQYRAAKMTYSMKKSSSEYPTIKTIY